MWYFVVGQLKGHFGTIDSENRYMYFWQNKVFAYFCTFNNAERMILTYVYRNTTLHIISNFSGHSLSNIAKIKDFQSALSVAQIWAKWLRIKRALRIVPFFTCKYALLLLAEKRVKRALSPLVCRLVHRHYTCFQCNTDGIRLTGYAWEGRQPCRNNTEYLNELI